MLIRRARGYAPAPVAVGAAREAPAILAVGAELKNTFCLLRRGQALVSEHIGDLKDASCKKITQIVDGKEQPRFEIRVDGQGGKQQVNVGADGAVEAKGAKDPKKDEPPAKGL